MADNVILCPVDLSPISIKALKKAAELARIYNAKLALLHVDEHLMDEKEMVMLRVNVKDFQERQKKYIGEVEKKMVEEIKKAGADDLKVDYIQKEGKKAYKEILEVADEINAYMIVMGTSGHSGIEELFLGSNAENVVRRSKIPVLTIRG